MRESGARGSGRRVLGVLGVTLAVVSVSLGVLVGPARAHTSADATLTRSIARLMTDGSVTATSAKVGVVVSDAVDRHTIYSRSSTQQLIPASTLKLFTAAAGLGYLGPGFRWRTDVYGASAPTGGVLSGNVYLRGLGDPTLREPDLATMAQTLRARGITRVTGSVVADASYFDNVRYNPTWSRDYQSRYYAAQVSGLTLSPDTDYDAGTVILVYRPGATSGSRATVSVVPPSAASYVRLVNWTRTTSTGATTFTAERSPGTNTITLRGTVRLGSSAGKEWVTVDDPALLAATVFRAQLVRAGIRVDGGVVRGTVPSGQTRWATRSSMTLGQLLVPFLKLSNNSHAEVITKTLGRRYGRPGNWTDGIAHLRTAATNLGVPMSGAVLVDGSGLSRSNHVSALQLQTLLLRAQGASWFSTFKVALPVAGTQPVRWVGGTLAGRMVDTPAEGRLRAKNGNLTGVTSLAGYVTSDSGRRLAFTMVSNYAYTSPRRVEDRLGALLGGW